MACDVGREKLDAYLDGELAPAEAAALSAHVRACNACASDALERVRMKRAVSAAARRHEPSPQFRQKIANIAGSKPGPASSSRKWFWMLATPALLVVILSLGVNFYVNRETGRRQRIYGELADLHVATLASATPVDVVSTDRHTVKPWFQGKIPFAFNLPELQGTDFTLVGGRVTYLAQSPGAQLIYQLRKHEISVFIFQDRSTDAASFASGSMNAFSFNMSSWTQDGLRYFVVGDVNRTDIEALSKLLRDAR